MSGRCAGCGQIDKNADVTREHTRYCRQFGQLYRLAPERALDPEAEYARWVEFDRAEMRSGRRDAHVTEADRRRAEQKARWRTPPDPLEELWACT